jgi:hypothetical protein
VTAETRSPITQLLGRIHRAVANGEVVATYREIEDARALGLIQDRDADRLVDLLCAMAGGQLPLSRPA